jgi:hypothetical protein
VALTPKARAVLVLRDVFDYSARETAKVLDMSEGAVKVTLHRARKLMESYDQERCVPTRALQDSTRALLQELVLRLTSGDVAGIEALLADDVRTVNDSDGEFSAARVPVLGRRKVANFWVKIRPDGPVDASVVMLNGLPALVARHLYAKKGIAPRVVVLLRPDRHGLVREVHGIVATRKIARVFAEGLAPRPG